MVSLAVNKRKMKAYSFDGETMIKILKGACIAGGAAFILAVMQALTTLDFGEFSGIAVAILSILINAVKEFISGDK